MELSTLRLRQVVDDEPHIVYSHLYDVRVFGFSLFAKAQEVLHPELLAMRIAFDCCAVDAVDNVAALVEGPFPAQLGHARAEIWPTLPGGRGVDAYLVVLDELLLGLDA